MFRALIYPFPLGDCSNNGFSKGETNCIVLTESESLPLEPTDRLPYFRLVKGSMGGNSWKLIPVYKAGATPRHSGFMAGGNIAEIDYQAAQALGLPNQFVKIHDRIE